MEPAPKAFAKKRTLRPEVEASPKSGNGEVEIPLARMGGVGYFRNSALSEIVRRGRIWPLLILLLLLLEYFGEEGDHL
jgi:hypothetical protein